MHGLVLESNPKRQEHNVSINPLNFTSNITAILGATILQRDNNARKTSV